jgi:hypothetical protein
MLNGEQRAEVPAGGFVAVLFASMPAPCLIRFISN